jgi:hypothetical protein
VFGSKGSIVDTPTHVSAFETHTPIACSSEVPEDPAKTDPISLTSFVLLPKHAV